MVENNLQNARNCIILKKILGGACPQTPLAKARSFAPRDMPLRGMYIQNPRNEKVGPHTLRNPAYAPVKNKERRKDLCPLFIILLSIEPFKYFV